MREYECMLILPAEADEALVGTAIERINKVIAADGGAIGQLDRWGRKRFAYEIDRTTEGYYVVVRFTAEPSEQAELERVLKLADEVIRHKILVAPQPRPRKERKGRTEATASPAPAEARAR